MKSIETMPDSSRVWVYQSDRQMTPEEGQKVQSQISSFLGSWMSHGEDLTAAVHISLNTYLIIAADERQVVAGGCSIDKLEKEIKAVGRLIGTDFFNRMLTGYMDEGQLKQVPLHQFWAMKKAGIIQGNTPVINTLIKNIGEWKTVWIQEFSDSWHQEMWAR